MMKKRCTAIVLAGGQGKRMERDVCKQYLEIGGKPLMYYSLQTFEESEIIDDVVLVVGKGQTEYVRQNIVDCFQFGKVDTIVEGGKERYHSVWEGLQVIRAQTMREPNTDGFTFIHDCARPFTDEAILKRAYESVQVHRACVVGVPSKDTVKITDDEAFARETPDRSKVWIIQTPQVFETSLIIEAYFKLMRENCSQVTDDAMVVELMMGLPVKMVQGTYENIKITTPEDLDIAEVFIKRKISKNCK